MALHDVQNMLARLYTETSFRDAFFADRAKALEKLSLSESERQPLLAVSQTQIERFARSLHSKRRSEVLPLLPLSRQVLGERFAALFARHSETYHPKGLLKPGDDARAFGHWAATLPELPLAVREVLRFESLRWQYHLHPLPFRLHVFRFRAVRRGENYRFEPGVTFFLATKRGGRIRSFSLPIPFRKTCTPLSHEVN